jgi:hypothetical protein
MDLAKRRKVETFLDVVARSALDASVSVSAVISALVGNLGLPRETAKRLERKAAALLTQLPDTDTPFGKLCQISTITGGKGDLEIYFANPKAFIYLAMQTDARMFHFIQALNHSDLLIVLYLDEAMPGNQYRPDRGRASQCVYWTLGQLPKWFLSGRNGWFPFCYIWVKALKRADITDSQLVCELVKLFDDVNIDNCNFAFEMNGVEFRFNIKVTVADWVQHKKTFCLKGHGGTVCCHWCANCVGRVPYFEDDDTLVHVGSSDYGRFVMHTYETTMHLADQIEHVVLHGTKPELEAIQQATGLKYEERGLLWDRPVRATLRLPHAAYTDWMHMLVASGGFAQYELNQMVSFIRFI